MNYLIVFLVSMMPVLELRGSIPIGYATGIHWIPCMLLSIIGNFLPVPFILLFIRVIFKWMKKIKFFAKIINWLETRAQKNSKKVLKYASWGLMIFVAIPLPGTGAWMGSLIAALLDMRLKYAIPSILGGVIIAGIIVTGVVYGFLDFLKFLVI